MSKRLGRFGGGLLALATMAVVSPSLAPGDEKWLEPSERDFFFAFGRDVSVGGKSYARPSNFRDLRDIAKVAPSPLGESIKSIAEALTRMRVSQQDRQEYIAKVRALEAEVRLRLGIAMVSILMGEPALDESIALVNGLLKLKSGSIADLWKLQAKWLKRALLAQAEANASLRRITGSLERRIGKTRTASDIQLGLRLQNSRLKVVGRLGKGTSKEPVVQVVMHRSPIGGQWLALNLVGAAGLRAMGVESMDFRAACQAGYLASLQELAARHPLVHVQLLPDVRSDAEVMINTGLSLGDIATLDRVELAVWSPEGWYRTESLPGVEAIRQEAARLAEAERRQRIHDAQTRLAKLSIKDQQAMQFAAMDQFIGKEASKVMGQYQRQETIRAEEFRRISNSNGRP